MRGELHEVLRGDAAVNTKSVGLSMKWGLGTEKFSPFGVLVSTFNSQILLVRVNEVKGNAGFLF